MKQTRQLLWMMLWITFPVFSFNGAENNDTSSQAPRFTSLVPDSTIQKSAGNSGSTRNQCGYGYGFTDKDGDGINDLFIDNNADGICDTDPTMAKTRFQSREQIRGKNLHGTHDGETAREGLRGSR